MNAIELTEAEVMSVSGGDPADAVLLAIIVHGIAMYMLESIWNAQPDGTQIGDITGA